jgi:hypothetical protein
MPDSGKFQRKEKFNATALFRSLETESQDETL